jgi:hypothetical protein
MRKYRFPNRAAAELHVQALDMEVVLHHIALNALLREEFRWTKKFEIKSGHWFQMGLARVGGGNGGICIVRESYPSNAGPSQSVYWADTWIRQTAETGGYTEQDPETIAYRQCFDALRRLQFDILEEVRAKSKATA